MSHLAKSKEGMRRDVEAEDVCKEKAIFCEFVTCLRKHQLQYSSYFLTIPITRVIVLTKNYLSIIMLYRLLLDLRIVFVARYVRLLDSSFMLSTGIQLLCNIIGISLVMIQVNILRIIY